MSKLKYIKMSLNISMTLNKEKRSFQTDQKEKYIASFLYKRNIICFR